MSREIEFRGKRVDGGEWVKGGFVPEYSEIYKSEWRELDSGMGYMMVEHHVIRETVGQYTGLKDMYDVKIFEGAIVKVWINGGEFIVPVVWGKSSHAWSLKCDRRAERFQSIKYYKLPAPKHIEVIGNIHDNPELLNG